MNKIVILGENIPSSLLRYFFEHESISYDCFKFQTKKNNISQYLAIRPSFFEWFEDIFNEKFVNFYPVNSIKIYSKENKIFDIYNNNGSYKHLFHMLKNQDIYEFFEHKKLSKFKIIEEKNDFFIDQNKRTITLGKDSYEYDLLINCDPKFNQLLGIQEVNQNYEELAITASFSITKPTYNTAKQFFLNDSIFAFLPHADDKFSIVWSCKKVLFDRIMKLSAKDFISEICNILETQPQTIKQIDKIESFPLFHMTNEPYQNTSVICIGNAAHQIHPLAGQGLNLSLKDVTVLIDILKSKFLANSKNILDIEKIIKEFKLNRELEVDFIGKVTKVIDWFAMNDKSSFNFLREKALPFVNKSNILKKIILRSVS